MPAEPRRSTMTSSVSLIALFASIGILAVHFVAAQIPERNYVANNIRKTDAARSGFQPWRHKP